eukprot:Hpha_TRINITY_DN16107_c1_g1::TRINITY_DN16107_c1_g1_i1::g.3990::m.3990
MRSEGDETLLCSVGAEVICASGYVRDGAVAVTDEAVYASTLEAEFLERCRVGDVMDLHRLTDAHGWFRFSTSTDQTFLIRPEEEDILLTSFREVLPLEVEDVGAAEVAAELELGAAECVALGLSPDAGAPEEMDEVARLEMARQQRLAAQARELELSAEGVEEARRDREEQRSQDAAAVRTAAESGMRRLSMRRRAASAVAAQLRRRQGSEVKREPSWWKGQWEPGVDPYLVDEEPLLAMKGVLDSRREASVTSSRETDGDSLPGISRVESQLAAGETESNPPPAPEEGGDAVQVPVCIAQGGRAERAVLSVTPDFLVARRPSGGEILRLPASSASRVAPFTLEGADSVQFLSLGDEPPHLLSCAASRVERLGQALAECFGATAHAASPRVVTDSGVWDALTPEARRRMLAPEGTVEDTRAGALGRATPPPAPRHAVGEGDKLREQLRTAREAAAGAEARRVEAEKKLRQEGMRRAAAERELELVSGRQRAEVERLEGEVRRLEA